MIGESPAKLRVFKAIGRLATIDVPILITGQSRTGKEFAAQAVHERSAFAGCGLAMPVVDFNRQFGRWHRRKAGRAT